MGVKRGLTNEEKQRIVDLIAEGAAMGEVATLLNWDTRTINKYVAEVHGRRKKQPDAGKRKITYRELWNVTRSLKKMPLATSRDIFHHARVVRPNRRTRNNILNHVAKVIKMSSKPPISKKNKLTRLDWAKKYMKCNFDDLFFTDECRASLDGTDAFGRRWLIDPGIRPGRFKCQQGGREWCFGMGSSTVPLLVLSSSKKG